MPDRGPQPGLGVGSDRETLRYRAVAPNKRGQTPGIAIADLSRRNGFADLNNLIAGRQYRDSGAWVDANLGDVHRGQHADVGRVQHATFGSDDIARHNVAPTPSNVLACLCGFQHPDLTVAGPGSPRPIDAVRVFERQHGVCAWGNGRSRHDAGRGAGLDSHLARAARGHLIDHVQRCGGICSCAGDVCRAQRISIECRVVEAGHVDPGRHVLGGDQPVRFRETHQSWGQGRHGCQNALACLIDGQERIGAGHYSGVPVVLPGQV